MRYYVNSFFLYSILGFILESVFFKIMGSSTHSGFLFGPFTVIYGISCVILMILDKYWFSKWSFNLVFKIVVMYFCCVVVLTGCEFVGGWFLDKVLAIELWNYSNKTFAVGKYICLEMAVVWGVLGVLFVYYIRPFGDKIVKKWTNGVTCLFGMGLVIDCLAFLISRV